MTLPPSLRTGPRREEPPPDEQPDGVVLPKTVTVRIEWPNGAIRQYVADNPSAFQQVIAASGQAAGLPPGFTRDAREPVVAIMFAGNPETGGIRVAATGKL